MSNINSLGSFMAYAGIGALGGAVGAGVGLGVGAAFGPFWGTIAGAGAYGLITASANAGYGGASFGEALFIGATTAATAMATAAILYGAGKAVGKVIDVIKQGRAQGQTAGLKVPVGEQGKGSASSSLNPDKGSIASESQALTSKGKRVEIKLLDIETDRGGFSYPPNRGFAGQPERMTLQPGTMVDRYGPTSGRFVSPQGVSAASRSLPPGVADLPLNTYRVLKPFEVYGGPSAPAFNQPGGGMQYELDRSVQELINEGYLGIVE